MDMIRHLRYFVAVAEELHFGRAADRLHMSQPPLSQRVQALERRVGGALFERTSRRVALTARGRLLLPEARRLVEHADQVAKFLDDLGTGEVDELVLGVPEGLAAPMVARMLADSRAAQPGAHVDLVPGPPAVLEAGLRSGRLQAAVLQHPLDADIARGQTLERPLGALVPADGDLAGEREVEVFELAGLDLVLATRDRAPAQYDRLLADLRALGYAPPQVRIADDPGMVAGQVLAGDAIAVVEEPAMPTPGLHWRPFAGGSLVIRASVAWLVAAPNQSPIRSAAAALERLLLDHGGWFPARAGAGVVRQERPASGLLS